MTELDFLQRVAQAAVQAQPKRQIRPIAKNENMGGCHHKDCIKRARWSLTHVGVHYQTCHKHKNLLEAIR